MCIAPMPPHEIAPARWVPDPRRAQLGARPSRFTTALGMREPPLDSLLFRFGTVPVAAIVVRFGSPRKKLA
jgi:hypothetical protein